MYLAGEISLELVPQGTLAERIRAHAAGIPAFYTPTGADTAVEQGAIPVRYNPGGMSKGVQIPGIPKESKSFGKKYILERAIEGDVAFIRAWKADEVGNCVFRYALPICRVLNLSFPATLRKISIPLWLGMPSLPLSRYA
jgi:3-oxoacid CoA-transferase